MKINKKNHWQQPWIAHKLLPDFAVEDVWLLPVELQPDQSLKQVHAAFNQAFQQMAETGAAGKLVQLRQLLGKWFKWEEEADFVPETITPGKLHKRYVSQQQPPATDLPKASDSLGHFTPVYRLPDESLLEIENKTVQAAIHLGKVPTSHNNYRVQMAVYVKPKGLFGKLYMQAIKPFRLLIVYPALMKGIKAQWKSQVNA